MLYDMMKRTTIFIPVGLDSRVSAEARSRRVSKADLVRQALEAYLDDDDVQLPTSVGCGTSPDDGVDSSNIKAWIRENWAKKLNADS